MIDRAGIELVDLVRQLLGVRGPSVPRIQERELRPRHRAHLHAIAEHRVGIIFDRVLQLLFPIGSFREPREVQRGAPGATPAFESFCWFVSSWWAIITRECDRRNSV
jgi:hypothetical protein